MVPPIPLGTLLRQRYLIQEILGQGGFGRTYLAVDQERFDERCVLKEFSVPFDEDVLIQKAQLLFQREASTLYQIHHLQIPRFWAAFEEGQRLFLVQDFVEGPTYRQLSGDRARQGQTFTEPEVRYLLKHILPVLSYVHDHGIIHRDISPDNIILKPARDIAATLSQTESGLPVLIDFGAVKEVTAQLIQTSGITRVGKVGYAPPEQLQTGRVYPNSDLYALAATCLVLLTGKEPRTLLDSQTLAWRWQSHAEVSQDLAAILQRMLAVYPGDRYQTAEAILNDLNPLAELSQAQTEIFPARSRPIRLPNSNPLGEKTATTPSTRSTLSVLFKQPNPAESSDLPRSNALSKRSRRSAQVSRSTQRAKEKSRLKYWVGGAFLLGMGVAGTILWQLFTENAPPTGEVWVAGAKLPQSEVSKIIGSSTDSSVNSVPSVTSATVSNGDFSNSLIRAVAEPQPIQFPAGKISTTLQGDLQGHSLQPYVLKAVQGQILTVTLQGSGVVMNLLRSSQDGIDAAAYQTRSWTGQLPADDEYLIQVSGSGTYSLDVAITPVSRPMQEKTDRVAFARGTNGTTVTGNLSPKQIRRYLLKAKQGQIVLVKVLQGRVNFSAIAPNGQRIGGTTLTSRDWKGRLPMDGDYVIELSATQTDDYALSFEIF